MLFEEALILVGIPLVLVLIGFIARRAELTVIGGIGLLVAGVIILASPLVVHQEVNYTSEQSYVWEGYCNVTDLFYNETSAEYETFNQIVNCTRDNYNVTYWYDGTELEPNNNMIIGLLIALFGLLGLMVGALTFRD